MKILFASSEAAPFFKSGGLGDVAGSLPKELLAKNVDVRVVLPLYSVLPEKYKEQLIDVTQFTVRVGWREQFCGVKMLELDGVTYYFIDNLQYFDRPSLYGYDDDGERFSYFSMALIEMLEKIEFIPDVIHVNDWHTAIVPVLLKDKYHWVESYHDIKTVLSIHNLQFQGRFGQEVLSDWLGIGYDSYNERGLQQFEDVNYLKGGIYFADRVTTVSPSYAREIQTPEFGYGLDGVLREVNYKLVGILNGIDYVRNNPETDSVIASNYSVDTLEKKLDNKSDLQQYAGLPEEKDTLLIGVVSRLTQQKGFQLVEIIMDALMERDVQVVVLGTGEAEIENSFKYFNWVYPEKFKAIIDFDIELAQKIYAGSDLFLMPSAFEPCGLSQMISMRYGTIPLIHEVGGLKDTVIPYNEYEGTGTGFTFEQFEWWDLLNKIDDALRVYYDKPKDWKQLVTQAMQTDFSWKKSTGQYIQVYNSITL